MTANEKLLLDELKAAHLIIRNALNLMTPSQKLRWSIQNDATGLISDGTTRANERQAVIDRFSRGGK